MNLQYEEFVKSISNIKYRKIKPDGFVAFDGKRDPTPLPQATQAPQARRSGTQPRPVLFPSQYPKSCKKIKERQEKKNRNSPRDTLRAYEHKARKVKTDGVTLVVPL